MAYTKMFLLSAALVSKGWSPAVQMLLFRHVLRSHVAFNPVSSHGIHGKRLAVHVWSLTLYWILNSLDICTRFLSLRLYQLNEREDKPFIALEDEALSILLWARTTTLSLANWSSDESLLGSLLLLYHRTLRTCTSPCLARSPRSLFHRRRLLFPSHYAHST
ncbi:hypothetical protein H4582DRAFT_1124521 [Lactarius indigo]|nr:hypothetical protein H4582DRAFT_1124521 [Lactarius indigo]